MTEDLRGRRPGENLRSDPYRTRHHEKGAEGEEYVGALLDALPSERWTVFHSIVVDGIGDVDHLVIGPPGVVVINTKNHRGHRVRVDGETITVAGRFQDYVKTAHRDQRRVHDLLAGAGASVAAVHTMLAIVVDSPAALVVVAEPLGVGVCRAEDLVARLEAKPGVASDEQTARTVRIAAADSTWGAVRPSVRRPVRRSMPRPTGRDARRSVPRAVQRSVRRPSPSEPRSDARRIGTLVAAVIASVVVLPILAMSLTLPVGRATGGGGESDSSEAREAAAGASSQQATGSFDEPTEPPTRMPAEPEFAYPLAAQDPLVRYLEASLASGGAEIALDFWVDAGIGAPALERATALAVVNSPYVYVDAWEIKGSTLTPHYRVDALAGQSRQIGTALRVGQAVDAVGSEDPVDARAVVAAIHDVIAATATYDADAAARAADGTLDPSDDAVDAIGALQGFGATGLGYARAFAAVGRELGLDVEVVTGEVDGMRHAWNLVEIDGAQLVVDVALDDADGSTPGEARLLLGPEEAASLGYRADPSPRP